MNREHFLVFIVLAFGAAFGCGEEAEVKHRHRLVTLV